MTIHLGLESRIAASGTEHPWRLVAYNDRMPNSTKAWRGSIPDTVYIRPPRDPVNGNLMDLGATLVEQAEDIAATLARHAAHGVRVGDHHEHLPIIEELRRRGIAITAHELEIPAPDELIDPYAIGGYAGHDIAMLARTEQTA